MTTTTPDRRLELDGVCNFRDLGGYATHDGRHVRWRTLFRADSLGGLTHADLDVLATLGLRTVVDLRTPAEVERRGRFPYERHPVTFHHVSVIDRTWDREQARRDGAPAVEFLHRAYLTMLDDGADRFAEAFTILAGADALPAVFHCAAGKDRTGLLAALVLGAIGVSHETIVDDYALTQDAMERFLATMALDEEAAAAIADTPPAFFVADPEAMRRVLDDVVAHHGSVRAYVRSIGVDADVLDELAATLLVRA